MIAARERGPRAPGGGRRDRGRPAGRRDRLRIRRRPGGVRHPGVRSQHVERGADRPVARERQPDGRRRDRPEQSGAALADADGRAADGAPARPAGGDPAARRPGDGGGHRGGLGAGGRHARRAAGRDGDHGQLRRRGRQHAGRRPATRRGDPDGLQGGGRRCARWFTRRGRRRHRGPAGAGTGEPAGRAAARRHRPGVRAGHPAGQRVHRLSRRRGAGRDRRHRRRRAADRAGRPRRPAPGTAAPSGVNVDFAPVADVAPQSGDESAIEGRMFGTDPERTGQLVAAAVRGYPERRRRGDAQALPGHRPARRRTPTSSCRPSPSRAARVERERGGADEGRASTPGRRW